MKSKISLFLFLLTITSSLAQNRYAEITYAFSSKGAQGVSVWKCVLVHNMANRKSTFINLGYASHPEDSKSETTSASGNTAINNYTYIENEQDPYYQKLFKEKRMLSYESLYGNKKYSITKEPLPVIEWKIEKETKSILNYKAQKASAHFRGRDYIAWFTPEIMISDGPFKFHGLPGLILKIKSTDGEYAYEAYSIKLNLYKSAYKSELLTKKFPKAKHYTLAEKVALIKENIEKQKKYMMSQDPGLTGVKIEVSGVELNYNDVL